MVVAQLNVKMGVCVMRYADVDDVIECCDEKELYYMIK